MKIEHIAMYVKDLEKAREFFVKYFNAKYNNIYINKQTGFKSYFLSFDNGARLEIMTRSEVIDIHKNIYNLGYNHIAFSLGSKDKVNELTKILIQDGYKIISGPRMTGDGYYESSIIAFEENQIEITV